MTSDSKKPFFSVVVAAYNCQKYILEALGSVQKQTFDDYEVVIIDDASTDNTHGIIAEYIQDKPNWTLYQNDTNVGVAQSRNRGFEIARGKYIAILDGDDVWYPQKMERQYHVMQSSGVQLCYTSYAFIDGDSRRIGRVYTTKPTATYKTLLKENFIGCSSAVFDARIAKQYKMDSGVMHEDYLFWLTLLKNGHAAKGVLEPLVGYRIHREGRSADKAKASRNRFDIYYRTEKLGLVRSVYYFACYSVKAFRKYSKLRPDKNDAADNAKRDGMRSLPSRTIRVLQVLDEISYNSGVSFVVGNWSMQTNPRIRFDYLVFTKHSDNIIRNIKNGESNIYIIPKFFLRNFLRYQAQYVKLLQSKQYDIVHLHTPVTAIMHLRVAKKNGVPVRIVHSHNARVSDTLFKSIRNKIAIAFSLHYASHFVACSGLAGNALFGRKRMKDAVIFRNVIDVNRFEFDAEIRRIIRRAYHLEDAAVILHVGRMSKQKNHAFLLKIFAKVLAKNAAAKLVLLGDGPLADKLKNQAKRLGIADAVKFIGVVDKPEEFMSAADMLLMPSLYEGLPLVALEAQVSGLRCVLSDTISKDAKFDDKCVFLPLGKADKWAEYVLSNIGEPRRACENTRGKNSVSIQHQNQQLARYYMDVREKQS